MNYISYKIEDNNFNYTYFNDSVKTDTIPLRIDGKINKKAIKVVEGVRNQIFLNNFKNIINEDISKLYYNINNNIINDETSYYLAKLITSSLMNKETINLSSLVEEKQEMFRDVEYLIEEIDTFNLINNKRGIQKNIDKIKQFNEIKYYIEEYYLPLINMKKRVF